MLKILKKYDWKRIDVVLIFMVLSLCAIGVFAVRQAGGADKGPGYMKNQLFGIALGIVIILIIMVMDYHFICRFAPIYYVGGVLLTLATHTPLGNDHTTDAVRWIDLGPITFQPSELMKVIFIIFIGWIYERWHKKVYKISTLVKVFLLTLIPMLAILSQPDLSSSLVVFFIMLSVAFAAGTSYRIFGWVFGITIPVLGLSLWYFTRPFSFSYKYLYENIYQFRRIVAWINPDTQNAMDANYQQLRSVSSIASGKLYGKFLVDGGVGSRVYNTVYVKESDFVWSVIGEEFGFLGCLLVLILYAILIIRCIRISKQAQSFQGRMIAIGVAAMFVFQVFTNISVATFMFPNTGLPLPFLSNGLSSMVSAMIGIGLVMNISIQPNKSSKGGLHLRSSYDDFYSIEDEMF
ncbi:MAG: FtsW/RodA/SpoVE family cell cycle protein [Lachnospiraceae bacterium]|nr:FtsW/RodA/SpoVE family cell cycle protein [Lachnospiraceae bacterium]